jgi:hypothetical protein
MQQLQAFGMQAIKVEKSQKVEDAKLNKGKGWKVLI